MEIFSIAQYLLYLSASGGMFFILFAGPTLAMCLMLLATSDALKAIVPAFIWGVCATFFAIVSISHIGWVWPFSATQIYPVGERYQLVTSLYQAAQLSYPEYLERQRSNEPPALESEAYSVGRYKVTGWNPPKHVYVDLENVKTGQGHPGLYVSKHCGTSPKLGEVYSLKVREFRMVGDPPSTLRTEFTDLYSAFCS